MPRPTSKTIARRLNGVALPALALPMIALACMAVPARAQTVEGSGRLFKQDPPAGTVLPKGSTVKLIFEPPT